MKIKKTMIMREIAGETILVPFGDAMHDSSGLFMVTETGAFIWKILPDCETIEDIVNKILNEYEADEVQVRKDVNDFLDRLRSFDIID